MYATWFGAVQGGEPSVVEEAALLMRPQSREGGRAVHVGRRAVGLERVDADLARRMHVVSRLGVKRRNVTGRALARTVEDRLAAFERNLVIRPGRRHGGR